jgi:hypothetical protein
MQRSDLVFRLRLLALFLGLMGLVWTGSFLALPSAWGAPADLLEMAIGHYDMGEFERSLEVLEQAEKGTKDPKILGSVFFFRGVNFAVLDKIAQARQAFVTALTYDQTLTADPGRFKESVVELFNSVKKEQEQRLPPSPTSAVQAPIKPEPSVPRPSVVRPGTRRWFLNVGLGGSIGFDSDISQLKLQQEFGAHFAPRSSGGAWSLVFQEGLNSGNTSVSDLLFEVGPRLSWDLPLSSRASIYLSPSLFCGFAYLSRSPLSSYVGVAALSVQPGLEFKLILADRMLIFLRPLGMELLYGGDRLDFSDGMVFRYNLMGGFGVTL